MNYIELTKSGEWLHPVNEAAIELVQNSIDGEVLYFKEARPREVKMLRCYFSLLNMVYDYLPDKFKKRIPKDMFYIFLKEIQEKYITIDLPSGATIKKYESISFDKMSEKRFREFIKEQLPVLYNDVLGAYFEGQILQNIIETIEMDYNKFFNKLFGTN